MPTYTFWAEMSCGGCSGAITRLIKKMPGVADVKCDLGENRVDVTTTQDYTVDQFMEKISKWAESAGKKVSATKI
eukprot:g358.t1